MTLERFYWDYDPGDFPCFIFGLHTMEIGRWRLNQFRCFVSLARALGWARLHGDALGGTLLCHLQAEGSGRLEMYLPGVWKPKALISVGVQEWDSLLDLFQICKTKHVKWHKIVNTTTIFNAKGKKVFIRLKSRKYLYENEIGRSQC